MVAIDSVLHTNQYSIDRVLGAGLPVLLVFWRNDVPASREFDAVLDRLAAEYAGRALIAKVDAAADQPLLARFDVRLLPTTVVARGGSTLATLPGRVPDQALAAWLRYAVDGGPSPAPATGPGVPATAEHTPTANGRTHHTADQTTTVRGQAPTGQVTTLTDATFDDAVRGSMP